jgi:hypothetical protein
MKCFGILAASALLLGVVGAASTFADGAELSGEYFRGQPPRARHRETAMTACGLRCRAICPDGYSCSPLYGGFRLPYANPAYWSRYTASGWTPY